MNDSNEKRLEISVPNQLEVVLRALNHDNPGVRCQGAKDARHIFSDPIMAEEAERLISTLCSKLQIDVVTEPSANQPGHNIFVAKPVEPNDNVRLLCARAIEAAVRHGFVIDSHVKTLESSARLDPYVQFGNDPEPIRTVIESALRIAGFVKEEHHQGPGRLSDPLGIGIPEKALRPDHETRMREGLANIRKRLVNSNPLPKGKPIIKAG